MARKGNIKVLLDGRGPLTLRETDYVTTGGEGSIYKTGPTIVKLYTDVDKMQRDGMPEKIKALAQLQHNGIVAPQGLVLDEHKQPVGFFMPFVEGEPMSRVFVSDFRARTGFGDRDAVDLTASMHEIVAYAHGKKALMVDANELNWLVSYTKGTPAGATVIDVDSWAVGRWPATVIMPSIRDWNAKTFSSATDWFAWGIVAFQVFTGIHPFKGKMDGYKPGDLVQRMKDNASVFGAGVRLPHSVRDFSCIPGPLLDWFQATFQQATRTTPPSPRDTSKPAKAAQIMRAVTTATGGLVFEKLFERAGDPVMRIWSNGAVRLASGGVCDLASGMTIGGMQNAAAEIIRLQNGWLIAVPSGSEVVFGHVSEDLKDRTLLPTAMNIRRIFRAGERLFGITDHEMVEIEVRVLNGRPMTIAGRRWNVMVKATSWFQDVAVTDVLGAAFVIMPTSDGGVSQIRVHELDGAKVVAAKAAGRFAAFSILERTGDYRKLELTFSKTGTGYTPWTGPADSAELNMGILARGVVAAIVNDGELAIVVPTTGTVKKIADRGITTAMKLATWGEKIVYIADGAVWQVRTAP